MPDESGSGMFTPCARMHCAYSRIWLTCCGFMLGGAPPLGSNDLQAFIAAFVFGSLGFMVTPLAFIWAAGPPFALALPVFLTIEPLVPAESGSCTLTPCWRMHCANRTPWVCGSTEAVVLAVLDWRWLPPFAEAIPDCAALLSQAATTIQKSSSGSAMSRAILAGRMDLIRFP